MKQGAYGDRKRSSHCRKGITVMEGIKSEQTKDMAPEELKALQQEVEGMTPEELRAFRDQKDADGMGFWGKEC